MSGSVEQMSGEAGFTLIELLVSIFLLLVTSAAAMALLTTTVRNEAPVRERSGEIQEGRTMVETVTREIRQGRTISAATSSQLQVLTFVNSDPCGGASSTTGRLCLVTYTCSGSSCSRTERSPDGSGTAPARIVASGLTSPEVFRYLPTASQALFVGVRLAFPPHGGGAPITLEDGVTLRNSYYPSG